MSSGVIDILGGRRLLGRKVKDPADLIARTREGLPFSVLEALTAQLDLPLEVVCQVLGIAPRTRARRRAQRVLRPDESDRLIRLARIVAHAVEVFGDRGRAATWLQRPVRSLGGATPLSLLDTDIGVQQVDDVLGRIEHGIIG